MKKVELSVIIITLNEERDLPRALRSVRNWADEVVVVDSGSSDRTVEIAKRYGAKVYVRKFDNYANQKNYAAGKVRGEWILSLDADEMIPGKLAREIKEVIKSKERVAYVIPRRNIIFGREIKHSRWSPDEHIWLWQKWKGKWVGEVHEEVVVEGKVGELTEAKIHYQYEKVGEFVEMIDRYTEFEAKKKVAAGEKFSWWKLGWYPALSFFRRFFYKKGFLDGKHGLVLGYLMAIYRLVTWVKVRELEGDSSKRRRGWWVVAGILGLAVILRVVNLNQGLWLDEAIGAVAVRDLSWQGIVDDFARVDNHPPFFYLALKGWYGMVGASDVGLRWMTVMMGVVGVGGVWVLADYWGKRIWRSGRKRREWAAWAALLLATSGLHVYYSQELRMYVMAATVAIWCMYFFLRSLREERWWAWWGLAGTMVVLAGSDYLPWLMFPVMWLSALIWRKEWKWWGRFVGAHLPILALGLWWWPIFWQQVEGGKWLLSKLPAWGQIAGGNSIKEVALVWVKFVIGRISFENKWVYGVVVGAASSPVVLGLVRAGRKWRKEVVPLWLWLGAPLVMGWLISFWVPAFTYFRWLFLLPAFYLVLSYGAVGWEKWGKWLGVGLLAVNLGGWAVYVADATLWREDWKGVVQFIKERRRPGEVVIFSWPEPVAPYRWYFAEDKLALGATNSIGADEKKTEMRTRAIVAGRRGVYQFLYLGDLSDPTGRVSRTLADGGWRQKEVWNFRGIGQLVYWSK